MGSPVWTNWLRFPWLSRRWTRRLWLSVAIGVAVILSIFSVPAQAIQVQLKPTTPELGDTISVVVQADPTNNPGSTPVVVMKQKTYPTFAIGGNRYRALLPTTPLDPPGTISIQVNPTQGNVAQGNVVQGNMAQANSAPGNATPQTLTVQLKD